MGATEDEMVGWHHRLNGHELEQAPGDSEGQGSLACCSSQDHKESEMTQQLNNNSLLVPLVFKPAEGTHLPNVRSQGWGAQYVV